MTDFKDVARKRELGVTVNNENLARKGELDNR